MAKGPELPGKPLGTSSAKELLVLAARQIGTLVAIERNRKGLTQSQLGGSVGLAQGGISRIERGEPLSSTGNDASIDNLFRTLGLARQFASFVKWWRDNGD